MIGLQYDSRILQMNSCPYNNTFKKVRDFGLLGL